MAILPRYARHIAKERERKRTHLTPKQKKFVAEYSVDHNGRRAAIAAGYSPRTAGAAAGSLLKHPYIAELVEARVTKQLKAAEITAERVLNEISLLAFANLQDLTRVDEEGDIVCDLKNATREQMAAIQEYTVDSTGGTGDGERVRILRRRLKMTDKAKALEMLAKYFKLLTDKVEHSADDSFTAAVAGARMRAKE